MPLSSVQILILAIGLLGGWIIENRLFRFGDKVGLENQVSLKRIQENSMTKFVYKYDENDIKVDNEDLYGVDLLLNLRVKLTHIKCIYIVIGNEQVKLEHMLGESLVNDRSLRLELLHNLNTEEGKQFKVMRKEIFPDLLVAQKKGSTLETWKLTEMFIDSLHLYSVKLLAYGSRMKSGIENAKAIGKFENVSWDVIRQLSIIAGAEKCAIEEWFKVNKIMNDYLDWIGYRLKLQTKAISDKKIVTKTMLERALISGTYADRNVYEIGVTNLTSKHDIWLQNRHPSEGIDLGNEKDTLEQSKVIKDRFLVIGFVTEFNINSESHVERKICPFEVRSD